MTPLAIMSAVPSWAIEENGGDRTESGNIVTNGRYLLHQWLHHVQKTLIRNPLFPEDLEGTGNIEKRVSWYLPNDEAGYSLWFNNEVDNSIIPADELESHISKFPGQTIQVPYPSVYFLSFQTNIPPFDDVHVRRAFSGAFDREKHINEWQQGQGFQMKHLSPPGVFGAPPSAVIGVGFDAEFARDELAAAGYPNSRKLSSDPVVNTPSFLFFPE